MKRFGSILAFGYVIIFCWIKVQETQGKPATTLSSTETEKFDMRNTTTTTEKMVSDYVSTTEQSPINNSSQEISVENSTTKIGSTSTSTFNTSTSSSTEEPSKSNNNNTSTSTTTTSSLILNPTTLSSNASTTTISTTEKGKENTEIEVTNTTTTEFPDFYDEELGPNVYSVQIEYIRPDVIPIVVFDYDE